MQDAIQYIPMSWFCRSAWSICNEIKALEDYKDDLRPSFNSTPTQFHIGDYAFRDLWLKEVYVSWTIPIRKGNRPFSDYTGTLYVPIGSKNYTSQLGHGINFKKSRNMTQREYIPPRKVEPSTK